MKYTVILAALAIGLASCGGGTQTNDTKTDKATKSETPKEDTQASKPEPVTLTIEGNDQMKYNKEEMRVKAGQEVTLVLKHVGEMDIKAMGHNWCLLKKGVDMKEFAMEAMKATDNQYIPVGTNKLITHTDMIGGGQETSVTFTAPKKGTYDYVCTFPGHFATMNGKLIVE